MSRNQNVRNVRDSRQYEQRRETKGNPKIVLNVNQTHKWIKRVNSKSFWIKCHAIRLNRKYFYFIFPSSKWEISFWISENEISFIIYFILSIPFHNFNLMQNKAKQNQRIENTYYSWRTDKLLRRSLNSRTIWKIQFWYEYFMWFSNVR